MAAALRPGSPVVSGKPTKPVRRVVVLHGAGLFAGAAIMGLLLVLARALIAGAGLRFLLVVPAGLALIVHPECQVPIGWLGLRTAYGARAEVAARTVCDIEPALAQASRVQ
jgi:hypothetical protein